MDQIPSNGVEQASNRPVGTFDVHEYAAGLVDEFSRQNAVLVQQVVGLKLQLKEQQDINHGQSRMLQLQGEEISRLRDGVTRSTELAEAPLVAGP